MNIHGKVGGGSTTSPSGGSDNGFFGEVISGAAEGISRIGSELLPVWTAQQLELQSSDQLNRSTFDPRFSGPRVDDVVNKPGGSVQSGGAQQTLFDKKIFTGPQFSLTLGGGIVIAVAILTTAVIVTR